MSASLPFPITRGALPSDGPRLPEPPPRSTVPDVIRYLNDPDLLKFCTAQVAQFNDRDADLLFIGDSITEGWLGPGKAVWDAHFASRNALDFGIDGDHTQHVLWRLENYPIQRLNPRVAVVLIGTNNVQNIAQEIADGVKAILTKTQTMYPGIRIILVSIMPNARAYDLTVAANAILRTFADGHSIHFLDLVPLMTPVGDNWKGLDADRLHPNELGYRIWADALLPLLDELAPSQVA